MNSEDTLEATELEVEMATEEVLATELLVFTDELELVAVEVTELELLVFTLLELDETAQIACTP